MFQTISMMKKTPKPILKRMIYGQVFVNLTTPKTITGKAGKMDKSETYLYIVKETAKALQNKDWSRKREIDIYKGKYNFTPEERLSFNDDVRKELI